MNLKLIFAYLCKIPLCGIVFFVGMIISGIVLPLMGFSSPEMPAGADENTVVIWFFLGSMLIALAFSFLSRQLPVHFLARWVILAELAWMIGAVSMVLESWFFMDTSAVSSVVNALYTLLNFAIPFMLLAGAVAILFPPLQKQEQILTGLKEFFSIRPWFSWLWRATVILAVYPMLYIAFGLLVEPFIRDFYAQGMYELTIPTWGQIIPLQLARSSLFLIACLPLAIWQNGTQKTKVISNSRGWRVQLWLALGLALFVLTAFMAVITAYWFPWQMRLFHGLELLATAFLYAGTFTWLFLPKKERKLQAITWKTAPAPE